MTQETFDEIRKFNSFDGSYDKASENVCLTYIDLNWLTSPDDYKENKRKLTPEQILSTERYQLKPFPQWPTSLAQDIIDDNPDNWIPPGKHSINISKSRSTAAMNSALKGGGGAILEDKTEPKEIDWTKPIQMRNGKRALYLGKSKHILTATVLCNKLDNAWVECDYNIDGRISLKSERPDDIINVPEKRKLEGWLNEYEEQTLHYSRTLESSIRHEKAMFESGYKLTARLDLSEYNIEYEEGEGL